MSRVQRIPDTARYAPDLVANDGYGLGEHPDLKPLDTRLIKAQLTFLDESCMDDIAHAARYLLKRISEYYEVIGYVGPTMASSVKNCEIGCVLGEWIVEPGRDPWRCSFNLLSLAWKSPAVVFNQARFSCLESALKLAAWEVSAIVPESQKAIHLGVLAAYRLMKEEAGDWSVVRCRSGTKSIVKVIARSIESAASLHITEVSGHCYFSRSAATHAA